ncbi:hypothetical protein [Actinosynnema sp. NPDC020468]|uniref:hypothetical protein n=1 Tax=Actinosynnema sp. NPDC020468 TaxID=3154488 RepID=UPI003411AD63
MVTTILNSGCRSVFASAVTLNCLSSHGCGGPGGGVGVAVVGAGLVVLLLLVAGTVLLGVGGFEVPPGCGEDPGSPRPTRAAVVQTAATSATTPRAIATTRRRQ